LTVPDRIERVLDLTHDAATVWEAITTAEGLGGWFGSSASIDLRPGGLAQVTWDQDQSTLSIKVVEPSHRFAFTWAIDGMPETDPRDTYVEFTLEPIPTGTRLTVVETGFAQAPEGPAERAHRDNQQGWEQELRELVEYLDARVA